MLHHHHAVEDASIWPLLLREVADDADRAVLRAMQAEHGQVDPALAGTTDAFAAMTEDPSEERRAALDAQVAAVRELLHEHLAHEEREALPLLQRTLSVRAVRGERRRRRRRAARSGRRRSSCRG